jgi:hypothetical protein
LDNLKNKKLLFISSDFFELRSAMQKEFENAGADVTFIVNKPSYFGSLFNKVFKKYMSVLYAFYYYIKLYKKQNYDYIFIINGEFIPYNQCQSLIKNNPNAKSILYCWDAFSSSKNSQNIYHLFDVSYSFSRLDCRNHDLQYKPLFYIYQEKEKIKKEYDFSTVASYSESRYKMLLNIKKILIQNDFNYLFHLFIREIGLYRESKRLKHKLDKDICKTMKLSNMKTSEIIAKSKCVLDLIDSTHEGQSLRIFECIANDTKILTTNDSIKSEEFYDGKMIKILDEDFTIDSEWLNYEGCYANKDQYHVSNWVKSFFDN